MTNKFWIVVSERSGPSPCPFRHYSEEAAFTEAERLARGSTGSKFFVFECKGASLRNDILTVRFDSNDSIPF